MISENKQFEIKIYTFIGRSFLCPMSNLQPGDVVCSILPIKKVDPQNKYQFVITETGTESASKDKLIKNETVVLTYRRPTLATHNQELLLMIEAAKTYLKENGKAQSKKN